MQGKTASASCENCLIPLCTADGGSKRIRLVMFLVLALLFVKTILSFTGVIDF
jgi:hypothetical protein